MKVSVDQAKCIGCGACAAMCPDVFELQGGKSHVVDAKCGKCDCKAAAEACPVQAISVK